MWTKLLAVAVFAAAMTVRLAAQQAGHQMPGQAASPQTPSPELLTVCVQAQQQASRMADRAQARLEAARQTNSPEDMRAAVDDLQAALGQIRSFLGQCQPLAAAAAPSGGHEGHQMGSMPRAPAAAPQTPPQTPMVQPESARPALVAPTAPAATDPHAGHAMPKPPPRPAASPRTPAMKPDSPKPEPSAAGPAREPHAGHGSTAAPAKEGTQAKVMDAVNGLMVDPMTAPKTTYQGQTYYFSSEETRREFMQNPAKFAKKPKQ